MLPKTQTGKKFRVSEFRVEELLNRTEIEIISVLKSNRTNLKTQNRKSLELVSFELKSC